MLTLAFTPFPEIQTTRLILRRIKKSDAPELFFLRSDKKVLKYIDKTPEISIKQTYAHLEKLRQLEKHGDAINWAITLRGADKLIGNICLWNIQKEHYRSEIGYVLHPAWQGIGIMNEAIKAVLETGFRKYKFHSIEANVNPKNAASIKLLKKNKFRREAYYLENYFFNGKFLDSAIYSLLAPALPLTTSSKKKKGKRMGK